MNKELKEQTIEEFIEEFGEYCPISNQKTVPEKYINFIDSLIDKTVQMTEERVVGVIDNYFNTVMFDEWSSGELISRITNKSDNKLK